MINYAMVIDTRTCIGCGDCVVACKTENKVPAGLNRDWVVEATSGRYPDLRTEFRSERCNHCSHPTCVTSCPTGASHTWKDSNIVLVAAEKCTGRCIHPGTPVAGRTSVASRPRCSTSASSRKRAIRW